eukprot:scaffold73583_cov35-Tisochrysis_lutea.AAC.2
MCLAAGSAFLGHLPYVRERRAWAGGRRGVAQALRLRARPSRSVGYENLERSDVSQTEYPDGGGSASAT